MNNFFHRDDFSKDEISKKILALIFFGAIFFCFAGEASAATYYLREDGAAINKSGAISCNATSTSMSVAVHNNEAFVPGDVIVICPDGGSITSVIIPPSSGSSIDGYITYDGDADSDGVKVEVQGAIGKYSKVDYLKFQNIHFTTSSKAIYLVEGSSNIWVTECFFDTLGQQGIFSSGINNTAYSQDWLIENSTFTNIGNYSDSAAADINAGGYSRRWTIRNTVHTGNGIAGVDGINFSNINVSGGDGAGHLIENNSFTNYYENGIDLKGTRESSAGEGGTVIRGCTFIGGSGSEGQIHIQFNAKGVLIDRCSFSDTNNNAISLVSHSTGLDAVGYVTVKNSVFDNVRNVIFTDRGLVNEEALGHNVLYNNTMLDSGQSSSGYSIDIGSDNYIVRNNVFYNISQNSFWDLPIRFELSDYYYSAQLDYNIYHKLDESNAKLFNINGVIYDIAQMRTDGGQEINGMNIDPVLQSDGKPEQNSPAIDAGLTIADISDDFLGVSRPQGAAYDIGAFEYVNAEDLTETCSDNIQNQDETGVDCGGVCDICDSRYSISNFISLLANWLQIGNETSDVNFDGIVNTRDLGIMMSNWEER
jgi:hypothetical protein